MFGYLSSNITNFAQSVIRLGELERLTLFNLTMSCQFILRTAMGAFTVVHCYNGSDDTRCPVHGLCSFDLFLIGKILGSMGVASKSNLRACIGVLLGAVFLGEYITPVILFGFITAILGVAAINTPIRIK